MAYITHTYPLTGMQCAGCAGRVDKVLAKQPGVISSTAHVETNTIEIEYDDAMTSPEIIAAVVANLGFELKI